MMDSLARFIIKYRWVSIITVVLLTIFLSIQIKDLRFNPDVIKSLPDSDPDARLLKEINEQFTVNNMGMVILEADDADDAGIDDHFSAGIAGGHFAVNGRAFQSDAEAGGLYHCVLLGMRGSYAMPALMAVRMGDRMHFVSRLIAVGQADRGADIAGGDYPFFTCDDAAGASAVAGASAADDLNDLQEIFVPGRPVIAFFDFNIFHIFCPLVWHRKTR